MLEWLIIGGGVHGAHCAHGLTRQQGIPPHRLRILDPYPEPLARHTCGYPIVDRTLRWQEGLYVTGALAEREIGPVARNIIGARLAATRLLSAP